MSRNMWDESKYNREFKKVCDNDRVLEMFAQNFESSQHRFQVFENHLSGFVLETGGVESPRTKCMHS